MLAPSFLLESQRPLAAVARNTSGFEIAATREIKAILLLAFFVKKFVDLLHAYYLILQMGVSQWLVCLKEKK